MYCNYYGFSEKPFNVTLDPKFLHLTSDHRESLTSIVYRIRERQGFITIIGEVGTGKTTLLNAAMDRMDGNIRAAFITNTDVTFNEMLNTALYEWGLTKDVEELSEVKAVQLLTRFAIEQWGKGGNVVLIVDEAQNLGDKVVEKLRLLSNLEVWEQKLIQIVLSGQPELDTKLDRHELPQLTQRINLRHYINPLHKTSTFDYIQHRLKVVTNSNALPFDSHALQMIWEYSGGIQRKINMLCDNALLIGYGLKQKKINGAIIQEAVEDLKWDRISKSKPPLNDFPIEAVSKSVEMKPSRHLLKLTATTVIVGIMALSGVFFLNRKGFHFAKRTDLFSGIKDAVTETVHQEQAKNQLQMSRPDIPEHIASNNSSSSQLFKNPEIKEVEKTQLNIVQDRILPIRYTVSLYYSREENTKLMEEIVIFLKNKGFEVNDVEKVEYNKKDIRFFHDEDRLGALLLKKHLTPFINTYFKNTNIKIVNLSDKYPNAKKGALELWVTF
jgi:type II secretory pathway predicted ATPase ExeA